MKLKKHLYDDILKYEHALEMYNKIKRSCRNRRAVYEFSLNLNTHIMNILLLLNVTTPFDRVPPANFNAV